MVIIASFVICPVVVASLLNLPSQDFKSLPSLNPLLQEQAKLPIELLHTCAHPDMFSEHSFISKNSLRF